MESRRSWQIQGFLHQPTLDAGRLEFPPSLHQSGSCACRASFWACRSDRRTLSPPLEAAEFSNRHFPIEAPAVHLGPSFSQLLYYPKRIGISRHIEVQDLTSVVADDEKAVQNTKRERWDGEEVHRRNGLAMVSEERQPSFHGMCISRGSPDPSRDTPFRDIETEFEQFAVNALSSPGQILGNHTEDQVANLFADTLPSS